MPYIRSDFFKIVSAGQEIYEASRKKEVVKYPQSFRSDIYIKAINLYKNRELVRGENHAFVFHAPEAKTMAIIDSNNNWIYFKGKGGKFVLDYIPSNTGEISIAYQKKGRTKFDIFLKYEVVNKNTI